MKHLLTIMIISLLSCKKDDNTTRQGIASTDPVAKNLNCQTIWYSPSISNINWSVTLNIPDTSSVASLTLRLASTLAPAFIIDKPKSQTYSLMQVNSACPSGAVEVYYFFEWKMTNGSIKKEDPFIVRG